MNWPGWLPWAQHKTLIAEREQAEAHADEVERNVIEPLRAMRNYDHLTRAVQREIVRQAREVRLD